MKKRKKTILILSTLFLLMPKIAYAMEYVTCGTDKKIPLVLATLTSTVMTIIKIIIPILIVISGMISFLKVTYSSNVEDEMKKAQSKLINSVIAAVIIFFIISIINFAVSLVAGANNNAMSCVNCLINPNKCEKIDEQGKKICPGFIDEEYDENCNPITNKHKDNTQSSTTSDTSTSNTNNTSNTNTNSNTNNSTDTSSNSNSANARLNTAVKALPNTARKALENKLNQINGTEIKEVNGATYINGILIVNKTYSLSPSYAPGDLTEETKNAFNEMRVDASKLGLNLYISSGYRSYETQEVTYNSFVNEEGKKSADTKSARPGHSEHQTGLAFDLNTINDAFGHTREGKWVNDNCYRYGLIIRYPNGKTNSTGYKYEPWHLRYVGKELAGKLYNNGNWITLEEYLKISSVYD